MNASTPCQHYCFHQIDLRPPLEVLAANLQKDSIRRKIRRAEHEGLICETGRSEPLLDEFWRLFLLTRRRHLAPPPPKRWFRNVLDSFGPAAAIRVAFHGKQAVAAIITLCCNQTMVYKYGCSDAAWHRVGGMPFLFWNSIQAARQAGLTAFDLGRSDCDATGLITFKNRLGAAQSVLTYYRFPATLSDGYATPSGGWTGRLRRTILPRLPDSLFCSVGGLLYKHLG
jgi:lipid II:glycine glycyltransferase (peptidoglycan interpeptide bridge formation enzyme)